MKSLSIRHSLFLSAAFVLASWPSSVISDVLPPDNVLQAKVLEVGSEMGLTEIYEDPDEGLFVWRVKLSAAKSGQARTECDALFAWYLKRVEDKVALNDPFLLLCGANPPAEILSETRPFQEEFKRRWLAAVGDVALIPPTTQTHSQDLEAEVLGLLSRESSPRVTRVLPTAPDGFTWRQLREINAAVLVPDEWRVKRETDKKLTAAVAYFVTLQNIDALGKFDTGMSLNVLMARSRSEDVESVAREKITADCMNRPVLKRLKSSSEVTGGVFHRYGCVARVRGKAGSIVIDHRLIVNTRTKTMYIVDFESPENQWEEAWKKGTKVVEMLSLDENI